MIKLNADVSSIMSQTGPKAAGADKIGAEKTKDSNFNNTVKALKNYLSDAEHLQQASDTSVKDLLAGKNDDITSVISAVSKADMSFKLLVGVRNKLIEAYKQTMNMQI